MEVIKDDYIRRIEAVKVLQKAYTEGRIKAKDGCVSVLDDINALPKVDVPHEKCGKWEHFVSRQSGAHYEVAASCSCCNEYTVTICGCKAMPFEFCPHCSADMRGDTNERH